MTRNEREAFKLFINMIKDSMPQLDGTVPVAFITLPVVKDEGDGIVINLDGRARVLWPSDFPKEDRGSLFKRLAGQYESGVVTTLKED